LEVTNGKGFPLALRMLLEKNRVSKRKTRFFIRGCGGFAPEKSMKRRARQASDAALAWFGFARQTHWRMGLRCRKLPEISL
jgi:hypothetical protein